MQVRSLLLFMGTLMLSVDGMQNKGSFNRPLIRQVPTIPFSEPVREPGEALARDFVINSLDDLDEWLVLKKTVETVLGRAEFPDAFGQDFWSRTQNELFFYLEEREKFSDKKDVFNRANNVFKSVVDVLEVLSEVLSKKLEKPEDREAAQADFIKNLTRYIEEVVREVVSLRSVDSDNSNKFAQTKFTEWFTQWEKKYRLERKYQEAVHEIRNFSHEVALGEMLTFAFITVKDYTTISQKYKVSLAAQKDGFQESFSTVDSLKIPFSVEKDVAQAIVQNYCKKTNCTKDDTSERLEHLENLSVVHDFIERIRYLPAQYKVAPEAFVSLFSALKEGASLPSMGGENQGVELPGVLAKESDEERANKIVSGKNSDATPNQKIEAFKVYSERALNKAFGKAGVKRWNNQVVLINKLKNFATNLFKNDSHEYWLFQNYLSAVLALHRYAFIILNSKEHSKEQRIKIIEAVVAVRVKFLHDCIEIFKKDVESLKLYVENVLPQNLNEESGGFLAVPESLGAELELGYDPSVYMQDPFAGREETAHYDNAFGIVGDIPESISMLLPEGLTLYHLIVGSQVGGTCFYQAVINAQALEYLIANKKPVNGKALRDEANKYKGEILKACSQNKKSNADRQKEFLNNYGPRLKLVSSRDKKNKKFNDINYSSKASFDKGLKYAVANLREKQQPGVVNIMCVYRDPEGVGNHAFVLSFVKLDENGPIRLLLMESNNLYLDVAAYRDKEKQEQAWWVRFLEALPGHLTHIVSIVQDELGENALPVRAAQSAPAPKRKNL